MANGKKHFEKVETVGINVGQFKNSSVEAMAVEVGKLAAEAFKILMDPNKNAETAGCQMLVYQDLAFEIEITPVTPDDDLVQMAIEKGLPKLADA